jgi:hypothetical protein
VTQKGPVKVTITGAQPPTVSGDPTTADRAISAAETPARSSRRLQGLEAVGPTGLSPGFRALAPALSPPVHPGSIPCGRRRGGVAKERFRIRLIPRTV